MNRERGRKALTTVAQSPLEAFSFLGPGGLCDMLTTASEGSEVDTVVWMPHPRTDSSGRKPTEAPLPQEGHQEEQGYDLKSGLAVWREMEQHSNCP